MATPQNSGGLVSPDLGDDQSQQKYSTNDSAHLQTLCELITETPVDFEDQVNRVLREGLTMLGLDLGIISNISDNNYTVLFFIPPNPP